MPWVKRYDFFVPGDPKGQPRMAPVLIDGGAFLRDPGTARAWRSRVEKAARAVRGAPIPIHQAVCIKLHFHMPNPHAYQGWHADKPDVDNLEKSTFDALTAAHIWKDDSQIALSITRKTWAAPGQETGAAVEIHTWESEPDGQNV